MTARVRNLAIAGLMLAGLIPVQPANAESLSCTEAAAAVEATGAVPPGLMLAIGNVESGRTDPRGLRSPWPWTINAGGVGRFFASAQDAVFAVGALRATGVQSVDVGCFQINLFHHPDAFPDLASGFDPLKNAQVAAQFLVSLHEELGTWELAIAAYHSRLSTLGAPYRDQVLAFWHGTSFAARPKFPGIHVWGPAGEVALGAVLSSPAPRQSVEASHRGRLPNVITISGRY